VPAPTSPRKRALMPSSPLRKALRGAGHHLSPVVQIGKEGATDAVLRQLDEALLAHELVKVKVGTESPEDRFELADRLGGTGAHVAQILGRTLLVYRRHPQKPRFEPRTAAELAADDDGADDAPRSRTRSSRAPRGRSASRAKPPPRGRSASGPKPRSGGRFASGPKPRSGGRSASGPKPRSGGRSASGPKPRSGGRFASGPKPRPGSRSAGPKPRPRGR
jgi:RNA-binding protein